MKSVQFNEAVNQKASIFSSKPRAEATVNAFPSAPSSAPGIFRPPNVADSQLHFLKWPIEDVIVNIRGSRLQSWSIL